VHLQWERPTASTCITPAALEQRVEALLGRAVFAPQDRADLQIAGNVEWSGAGWVATLRIDARDASLHGFRQLRQDGTDCAALNSPLTVVLATLIDVAQSESARDEGVAIAIGAAAALGLGVLPKPAAGASLWVGVLPNPAWSVWLDASTWLPVTKLDATQRGASFDAWQAGLALCRELRASARLTLAVCADGQFGAIAGEGRGLGPNRASHLLIAETGLELAASLQLSSIVSLRASTGAAVFLSRQPFYAEMADGTPVDIFRPALFGGQLRAGVLVTTR
jgi:hypothetical protein